MDGFLPGVADNLCAYVYLLIDPRNGSVFYVGKGRADRCFTHVDEARKTVADSVGDYAKLARIREIESAGDRVVIAILRHGLTDEQALLVESTSIDLMRLIDPDNLLTRIRGLESSAFGWMSVWHINGLYGARDVEFDPAHRVALIRINRLYRQNMTDDELYEATRKWWKIGAHRTDLDSIAAPQWAMAVYRGVVRAVYRIDEWRQATPEELEANPTWRRRWAFTGTHDHAEMKARYLYRDVSRYMPGQNPVCYVNCGTAAPGMTQG